MRCTTLLLAVLFGSALLVACESDTAQTPEEQNVEAMAREHANDAATPSPAATEAPMRTVISERLAYAEVNDELVYGYFAFPEDMLEPLPAIIMIHEWWGLNDNIRAMADRLAAEGYIVLAVDMFDGNVATTPKTAQVQMKRVVDNPALAVENLRQALSFVADTAGAPAVATLGWCFGGGWSLNAAIEFPGQLDATVIYYGHVNDDAERLDAIESPILGLFAENDRGIQVDSVRAFESTLNQLQKTADIHVYPGVGHAFANPTGNRYDAESAADAWQKTLEFLRTELQAADDS